MKTPYYLRAKLNRSAIFAQAMRTAFPGDGRMSSSTESAEGRASIEGASARAKRTEKPQELLRPDSGSSAPPAHPIITEADIAAKVQNTVGTGPDFDTLLTDPEYDRRATAITAAREEQE